ncbi:MULTISPECIES: hypothetical protein [unclassified Caballeronia]|uniref:hypothetical protein n=1 Tax=unclassified Caballeronia TaxID=2646786 RepID=UPI00285B3116|nr:MULTISPECIES: hypothetical protein [unclassified Caballeronia]MDR5741474.1 hypothetical protein [Caballeronia sp. LZ016]MDR5806787.1 hypothetical protein [Caballeronia sp. LZ019]
MNENDNDNGHTAQGEVRLTIDGAAAHVVFDRADAHNAPITMRVSKQSMSPMLAALPLQGDDLVRQRYGSEDFHEGVAAFTDKRPAGWIGV